MYLGTVGSAVETKISLNNASRGEAFSLSREMMKSPPRGVEVTTCIKKYQSDYYYIKRFLFFGIIMESQQ